MYGQAGTHHQKMLQLGDYVFLDIFQEPSPRQSMHAHCSHLHVGH